jgi:hypothetical protein
MVLALAILLAFGGFWWLLLRNARRADADTDQPDGDWVDLSRLPAECRGERFPRK